MLELWASAVTSGFIVLRTLGIALGPSQGLPSPFKVTVESLFYLLGLLETVFSCVALLFVDQAGSRLRDLPASVSRVLGVKVCALTTGES